jgi:hypothetical protein
LNPQFNFDVESLEIAAYNTKCGSALKEHQPAITISNENYFGAPETAGDGTACFSVADGGSTIW